MKTPSALNEILAGERDIGAFAQKLIRKLAILACFGFLFLIFPQGRRIFFNIAEWAARHPLGNHDLRDWMLLTGALGGFFAFYTIWRIFSQKTTEWRETKNKKYAAGSILLIVLYAAAGTLFCALSDSIWDDEFLTLNTIAQPFADILKIEAGDVHPPLYFLMLKTWSLAAGNSIFALKLFSVIPAILTMIALREFLRREFSEKAAFFSLLAFAAAARNCHYFVELRMYSWALLFTTTTALAMWLVAKTNKPIWWAALLLSVEAAAWTHYYAGASVAIGGALFFAWFLLNKDKRRHLPVLLFFALAAGALYAPWVPSALSAFSQTEGAFWAWKMDAGDAIACFTNYFWCGGEGITPVFTALAAGVFAAFFIRKEKEKKAWFAVAAASTGVLLGVLCITFSLAGRPIFATRYFYPISGTVWLFFGVAAATINNRRLTWTIGALLGALTVASLAAAFNYEKKEGEAQREFRTWFQTQIRAGDILVFPTEKSAYELRNITHFFPNNSFVATNGDETNIYAKTGKIKRWFGDDFYLQYRYSNKEKLHISTIAGEAQKEKFSNRRVWIFKLLNSQDKLPELDLEKSAAQLGLTKARLPKQRHYANSEPTAFGWGGGQADGFRFYLYEAPSAYEFAKWFYEHKRQSGQSARSGL